ncbi:hypothetical protein JQ612_04690 [Bradyrhizobium manausense]|uniref:hypothetical protein n=1 Tax=Bradyrhizobium manausense TaxID=989370 RepID=UPI001BAB96E7|nr:hypothetical protein [Bradyrhizobium manausense]MBR0688113.1 hypothetical protein [Bradyrhizobium manausense]MBR0724250.1 hypothetical protein [Bradyrhizobium manausense]MBR0832482.1 hypothetical protein [Bradyrhizobium manausense]
MDQDNRSQELDQIRLALAVLSVQLDALAARKDRNAIAPSDGAAEADEVAGKVDQSFALRAVLAMRHCSTLQNEY